MEAADFLALNVKCLMQGATWRMSDFDFFPFQEARLSCGKNEKGGKKMALGIFGT